MKTESQTGLLLTPEEVATALRLPIRGVYRLIRQRRIEAVRVGPRLIRVLKSDLEQYLADLRRKGA